MAWQDGSGESLRCDCFRMMLLPFTKLSSVHHKWPRQGPYQSEKQEEKWTCSDGNGSTAQWQAHMYLPVPRRLPVCSQGLVHCKNGPTWLLQTVTCIGHCIKICATANDWIWIYCYILYECDFLYNRFIGEVNAYLRAPFWHNPCCRSRAATSPGHREENVIEGQQHILHNKQVRSRLSKRTMIPWNRSGVWE